MTILRGRLAVACGQFITIRLCRRSQCPKSALRPISIWPYCAIAKAELGKRRVFITKSESNSAAPSSSPGSRIQGIPSGNLNDAWLAARVRFPPACGMSTIYQKHDALRWKYGIVVVPWSVRPRFRRDRREHPGELVIHFSPDRSQWLRSKTSHD
jgi:hypothetical protein